MPSLQELLQSGDRNALNAYLQGKTITGDGNNVYVDGQPLVLNRLSALSNGQPMQQDSFQQPMNTIRASSGEYITPQGTRSATPAQFQSAPQQQQFQGSPVDVFGQGKGYMQPDGTIIGINQQGQQFRVQPEGMNAANLANRFMRAKIANEERQAMSEDKQKIPMAPVAYVDDKGNTIWGTITEAKGKPAANFSPTVQGQLSGAKASGKETGQATGESVAKLQDMESALPRLESVVSELSTLGKKATYTKAGQFYNTARREFGMDVGEGAVARKEYISKVDNEILPLLRQTFGAQFTQKEGESLKITLGDPNASPEEKDAVLRSFIQTKKEQIATLRRRTEQSNNQPNTNNAGTNQDAEAIAWAKSNPRDPRAAKILSIHGM